MGSHKMKEEHRINAIGHTTPFYIISRHLYGDMSHIIVATIISLYSLLRDAYYATLTTRRLLRDAYYAMLTTQHLLCDAYYVMFTTRHLTARCLVSESKHVWLLSLLCSTRPPLCGTSTPLLLSPCCECGAVAT